MLRAHGKMSLYEDSARVPLIIQGPGIPQGEVCQEPVSLLDLYRTVAQAVGIAPAPLARGQSLLAMETDRPDYTFTESHANGRITGSFMIRTREWKLIENLGYEPMLFNLAEDPEEMNDLGGEANSKEPIRKVLLEMRQRLYLICSPEAVTARAKEAARIPGGERATLRGTGKALLPPECGETPSRPAGRGAEIRYQVVVRSSSSKVLTHELVKSQEGSSNM